MSEDPYRLNDPYRNNQETRLRAVEDRLGKIEAKLETANQNTGGRVDSILASLNYAAQCGQLAMVQQLSDLLKELAR